MKSFALLGLAAAAMAMPQASNPTGCSASAPGSFRITTVNLTSTQTKRELSKRQGAVTLTLSLQNGILKDQSGRVGYVASNYQFQFDAPVQAGARETSGWALCGNQSLALGSSTVFYQCLSGNFYNLYTTAAGAGCIPINIQADTSGNTNQIPDGQPQASSPGKVSQISDGQPQATAPGPKPYVTQISDGQIQATAPGPKPYVTQISDGQPQATAPGPKPYVTQISDGQPQATAPGPKPYVSQISDGQPQATAPGPKPSAFTGAAVAGAGSVGAVAAGIFGAIALL